MLKLRFDVSQYTPEEIVVKTVDNKLLVSESAGSRRLTLMFKMFVESTTIRRSAIVLPVCRESVTPTVIQRRVQYDRLRIPRERGNRGNEPKCVT